MKRQLFMHASLLALALAALTACGESSNTPAGSATPATSQAVQDGPVDVTATMDKSSVLIAEPFTLTIQATAPRGVEVRLPDTSEQIGDFDVLDVKDAPAVPTGDQRVWTRMYTLDSTRTGRLDAPVLTLSWLDRRNEADVQSGDVKTPEMKIDIRSVLEANADPTKYRDIKGEVDLPEPATPTPWTTYALVAGSAAVLLAVMLAVAFRRRKRSLSAAQAAYERFDALEAEGLAEQGELHAFYYRLTDILRVYIEERFDIAATTQTSAQFLSQVQRKRSLPEEHRAHLAEVLEIADLVKYAHFDPGQAAAREALTAARQFVEDTSRDPGEDDADELSRDAVEELIQ